MDLADRLSRIEAKLVPRARMTFWIHYVSPGHLDRPVRRIWHGSQEWHRRDGESDEAFQRRAESEAVLQPGYAGHLMQMD